MLAIIYLAVLIILGDAVCRRFFSYVSLPHRVAASFLAGLIISSWFTYLSGLAFARTARPLLWGNLLFFSCAGALIYWLRKRRLIDRSDPPPRPAGSDKWDWAAIGLFLVVAWWMMASSFNMNAGRLQIANHEWSDFGPNVAIMQSFALGHNFPTEYPHFSGDRIRYHFLFYFQAGNLEYLGLTPSTSNNLLSAFSLASMLMLVMVLGELLFNSRVVGRLGAALFFFHGSLSYIPFLRSQGSVTKALSATKQLQGFLPSGFPYRGEDWGVWSLVNFLNQRHFASAIGLLLLVLVFVVDRYRQATASQSDAASTPPPSPDDLLMESTTLGASASPEDGERKRSWKSLLWDVRGFVFAGALLGLMPLWNGAVFIAAAAVLLVLFLLFPLRKQMLALAVAAAVLALPQVIYLRTGHVRKAGYSLFHWGYTLERPTILNVLKYLSFTFGFKWLLIAFALYLATRFQRRMMLAISALLAVAFLFQFSEEVLANHKFLNIWLIVANLFVAYGLWQVWQITVRGNALVGRLATAMLLVLVVLGGVIDLFPIRNSYFVEIPFNGDPLVRWVSEQTDPKAVFLTDRFVTHRLLLAGRRVFHGWPYFTWGAGHLADERDVVYKRLFEERNPLEILKLLHENNISYVAIDNGVRQGGFIKNINEPVYEANFERVFQDKDNRYDQLAIYKVPATSRDFKLMLVTASATDANRAASASQVNAFEGGHGTGFGQFEKPRGIAVDHSGNIYVTDTGNARIEKFSPQGDFLSFIGKSGSGEGELREPNGIAIDAKGNIYVTDAANHRLNRFKSDGTYVRQWTGPEPGFYGPRDVSIGPNKQLYVLDQGRTRVVRIDPDGEVVGQWGRRGSSEGEFLEPTGIEVGGNLVFVTDAGNNRMQVFDLDGKFVRQWQVPEWDKYLWHYPDAAFDEATSRLYVTSGWTKEVLVFDIEGNRFKSLAPPIPDALDNPSSIVLSNTNSSRRLAVLNTGGANVSIFQLDPGKTK